MNRMTTVPRRLFGIPATDAPIVAIIGRGPSQWASVGRWDVDAMTYEPGARLYARVYSERCDLSPDGQYLCYFTLNPGTDWAAGDTYVTLKRYPLGFSTEKRPAFLWNEGEGGETSATPARAADDMWDERRGEAIVMMKPNARTGVVLQVRGGPMASFGYGELTQQTCPRYSLHFADGSSERLAGVQWADWSGDGRLLVATLGGELQIREGDEVVWSCDTSEHSSRRVAPPEARVW
jgi:hypothetical protein